MIEEWLDSIITENQPRRFDMADAYNPFASSQRVIDEGEALSKQMGKDIRRTIIVGSIVAGLPIAIVAAQYGWDWHKNKKLDEPERADMADTAAATGRASDSMRAGLRRNRTNRGGIGISMEQRQNMGLLDFLRVPPEEAEMLRQRATEARERADMASPWRGIRSFRRLLERYPAGSAGAGIAGTGVAGVGATGVVVADRTDMQVDFLEDAEEILKSPGTRMRKILMAKLLEGAESRTDMAVGGQVMNWARRHPNIASGALGVTAATVPLGAVFGTKAIVDSRSEPDTKWGREREVTKPWRGPSYPGDWSNDDDLSEWFESLTPIEQLDYHNQFGEPGTFSPHGITWDYTHPEAQAIWRDQESQYLGRTDMAPRIPSFIRRHPLVTGATGAVGAGAAGLVGLDNITPKKDFQQGIRPHLDTLAQGWDPPQEPLDLQGQVFDAVNSPEIQQLMDEHGVSERMAQIIAEHHIKQSWKSRPENDRQDMEPVRTHSAADRDAIERYGPEVFDYRAKWEDMSLAEQAQNHSRSGLWPSISPYTTDPENWPEHQQAFAMLSPKDQRSFIFDMDMETAAKENAALYDALHAENRGYYDDTPTGSHYDAMQKLYG